MALKQVSKDEESPSKRLWWVVRRPAKWKQNEREHQNCWWWGDLRPLGATWGTGV